jgi:hypothetical protein
MSVQSSFASAASSWAASGKWSLQTDHTDKLTVL